MTAPKQKKPKPTPEETRQENERRQAFIEEFFLNNMNGTQAAIAAGYAGGAAARVTACRLLTIPNIRAEIDKRLKAMQLSADEVLARLSDHASGTLAYFFNAAGEIDLTTPEAKAHFHLLKKVKRTVRRDGSVSIEIEVHDPQSANVHVGKYHKLFTERFEHSGEVTFDLRMPDDHTDSAES